jgi:membrane-bound lytic murein transglycosylase D
LGEARLREVNDIPPQMLIRSGSTLLVPRSAASDIDVPEALAASAALALTPEAGGSRRAMLRAGAKGDTVAAVARRHGLTAAQVGQWNRLAANGRFAPGQQIVLMLPARTITAGARSRTAARAIRPAARVRVARR